MRKASFRFELERNWSVKYVLASAWETWRWQRHMQGCMLAQGRCCIMHFVSTSFPSRFSMVTRRCSLQKHMCLDRNVGSYRLHSGRMSPRMLVVQGIIVGEVSFYLRARVCSFHTPLLSRPTAAAVFQCVVDHLYCELNRTETTKRALQQLCLLTLTRRDHFATESLGTRFLSSQENKLPDRPAPWPTPLATSIAQPYHRAISLLLLREDNSAPRCTRQEAYESCTPVCDCSPRRRSFEHGIRGFQAISLQPLYRKATSDLTSPLPHARASACTRVLEHSTTETSVHPTSYFTSVLQRASILPSVLPTWRRLEEPRATTSATSRTCLSAPALPTRPRRTTHRR